MSTICKRQSEKMNSRNPRNVGRYETVSVIKVRYICDICGHQIYGSQAFKKHMRSCNSSFNSNDGEYDSDDMIAGPISQYKYVCYHCSFQTNFKSYMQSHIFSHERVCPFCLTSHQSKTELFKHLEEDHYNIQLREVNKVLDAKDIGKSGIRLNKQVVNLIELMSTTLSVDASESWNQEEPRFSYLDKLKAIDQDIHEDLNGLSLIDRPGTSSDYHPVQRTGSHQDSSQKLLRMDAFRVGTNHCEEPELDPEVLVSSSDLPEMVVKGLINDLLDRVVNTVRCRDANIIKCHIANECDEMYTTDDDSNDIEEDEHSYGTESDDSEMYTTSDSSIIALSDNSSDEDYHTTSYTVKPHRHHQRFISFQPHKLNLQRQIKIGMKYSSCSKPLQGIKSLSRNPQSQRLTGTESKTTIKYIPDVIIELDSDEEQSCTSSEARSTQHKDTTRKMSAASEKRIENAAKEKRKQIEEDRELIADILANDDENVPMKSDRKKQASSQQESQVESRKENLFFSTKENNIKSMKDNQRKSTKEVIKKTTNDNQIKSKRDQIKSVRKYQYKSDNKNQPKPKKSRKQTMQFDLQDTLNKAVDNFRSVGNLNKAICFNANDDGIGVDNTKSNIDKDRKVSGCPKPEFISSVDDADPFHIDNASTSQHLTKDSPVQNAPLVQVSDDYDEMKALEDFMMDQNITPVGRKSEKREEMDKGLPFKKRSSTGNYHDSPNGNQENFKSPIISKSKKLKTCSSTKKTASLKEFQIGSDQPNQRKSIKSKFDNIQSCRYQKLTKPKDLTKPQTLPLKKRAIVEPVACSSKPLAIAIGSRQRAKSKRLSYEKALPPSLRTNKRPVLCVQFVSDLGIPPIKRLKGS